MISTPIHLSQLTGVAVGNGLLTPDPVDIGEPVPPEPAPVDMYEGPPLVLVPLTATEEENSPDAVPDAEIGSV